MIDCASIIFPITPPVELVATMSVSLPMAVYVWEDELLDVLPCIEQPKYPPVKAIEFHTSITSKFYGDDYAVKA